ncbi:unnamed protein product [Paramecium sonneborni]|uniref:Transmembrane protein n=1 Tax=Paramecium sonneborni TaxID=65129 RepID=A0A8S1LH66_9CILI|nr:unnamed protein product [Paramecium sonneborni]
MEDNCEEKQQISSQIPQTQNNNNVIEDQKKKYLTSKCKWISFTVTFFFLIGIGIFLGIYLSQNAKTAPTLKKFQKDEFLQIDEICMYHTSDKIQNCTQIEMNTKRIVNDLNEKNASSLLMLTALKVRTFTQNPDGTREYNEMINENTEIDQQVKKSLRILQKSAESNNFCEGIPQNECGNLNEVPLITLITDQQTGGVQQIGIPLEIPDLILQPLVSNIIHIAPNVAETGEITQSNGTRLLDEHSTNLYYVGKQAFVPKISKSRSWFGRTVVKKTISQQNQVKESSGINLFDKFEQSQETSLDENNYLVSSHITTSSKLDNTIKSENINQQTQDLTDKSETEITNDSNLVTVETTIDEALTNALTEIQNLQNLQYYSIEEIQDRIQTQQNLDKNLQQANRQLQEENGDVQSYSETDYDQQEGGCDSTIFNQKRTLKEATVLKQKIGLVVEFKGQLQNEDISGQLRSCISLNSNCIQDLYKKDFSYERKPIQSVNKSGSRTQNIFQITVLIMGYPLNIGADYNYSWGYNESPVQTENEIGLSGQIYAALGVTAYGEFSLVHVINIRAGVQGYIFKGSVNGVAQFKFNNVDKVIETKKYIIFLDFQIEVLTFDVYASYQNITLRWERKCVGKRWYKICWYIPIIDYTNWKDIYRKSFQLAKLQPSKRIFQIKSKCY